MNELFWLECELKSACSGQIYRRKKVNYDIDEVTLRSGPYRLVKSDGRTFCDADRANNNEIRSVFDSAKMHMRIRSYNTTFYCTIQLYILIPISVSQSDRSIHCTILYNYCTVPSAISVYIAPR